MPLTTRCICATKMTFTGDERRGPLTLWVAAESCSLCNTFYRTPSTPSSSSSSSSTLPLHNPTWCSAASAGQGVGHELTTAFSGCVGRPGNVRPIFAFNSRNELFVWGIRMTQGRAQRKERGLRWVIKYFCYEVLTPVGQASHGTISKMKQATLGHLNEIASAFNAHTESETRRLRVEQSLHRQSLAEFERVQAERRLTRRHELAYEALSSTIPSPIINIIAGLLGHTAPTGSELQEEIHEATVERVRHTLATSGIPHALILIIILYTYIP
jgi:hypothetical protein